MAGFSFQNLFKPRHKTPLAQVDNGEMSGFGEEAGPVAGQTGIMDADDRKRHERVRLGVIGGVSIGAILLLFMIFPPGAKPVGEDPAVVEARRKQTMALTQSPRADTDWLSNMENRQTATENALAAIQEQLAVVAGDRGIGAPNGAPTTAQDSAEIQRIAAEASAAIERAAARVDAAEQRAAQATLRRSVGGGGVDATAPPAAVVGATGGGNYRPGNSPSGYNPLGGPAGGAPRGAPSTSDPFRPVEGGAASTAARAGISTVRFERKDQVGSSETGAPAAGTLEQIDTRRTIPVNAYAPGRVLLGANASTGVSNSADPLPVLIRLTGPAISVGRGGRRASTEVTGCLLNGSARADLASERVYVRGAKMTCPTGVANKVITVDVEAFITSRGTGGVRGTVVSREGDAAQRALIAGTLQGLGQAVGSATQRSLVLGADGTAGQGSLTAGEALGGAAGQGLSSAAGQLSQYWIRRAEQYQPVIEMPVGSDVEVVFLGPVTVR
ncbi:hypothetical protein PbB2_02777 [Candidatus Phycosocius bacilliformis]|uniref:Bacterial conjugation TrbI-like protein n=1 Tax=Candidatus Phycosocius bacilliformis TaxID=1445552 RepID=A0A2P2EDD5_9PROT|nr:TraB/VirB10 family protein [Candidatus Phycosocius bacilliformis]GBF59085.1 hypothetical protein PbB2_02777 [Candidatus Phycosocius bacilliformis]